MSDLPSAPMTGPFRGGQASQLCGVCRAPTEHACDKCELPLCSQHARHDQNPCAGCETRCAECDTIIRKDLVCKRCSRPLCWPHRPIVDRWCKACQVDWEQSTLARRGRRRGRLLLAGLLSIPVAAGSILAGHLAAVPAVVVTLILLGPTAIVGRWAILKGLRRRFLKQGREEAALKAAEQPALLPGGRKTETAPEQ